MSKQIIGHALYQGCLALVIGNVVEYAMPKYKGGASDLRLVGELALQLGATAALTYALSKSAVVQTEDPIGGVTYFIVLSQAQEGLSQRVREVGRRIQRTLA